MDRLLKASIAAEIAPWGKVSVENKDQQDAWETEEAPWSVCRGIECRNNAQHKSERCKEC